MLSRSGKIRLRQLTGLRRSFTFLLFSAETVYRCVQTVGTSWCRLTAAWFWIKWSLQMRALTPVMLTLASTLWVPRLRFESRKTRSKVRITLVNICVYNTEHLNLNLDHWPDCHSWAFIVSKGLIWSVLSWFYRVLKALSSAATGADVPPECVDQPELANCKLIVYARLCSNLYYSSFCCASCTRHLQRNDRLGRLGWVQKLGSGAAGQMGEGTGNICSWPNHHLKMDAAALNTEYGNMK